MPQVTNTFIRSKMNKDLDARLLPNSEYRDAKNLQLSRSEGSEVGEFDNIPGNIQLTGLKTGLGARVIGQFTDETNNILYVYSSGYTGGDRCPRDIQVFSEPGAAGTVTGTVIELYNSAGQLLNADNLGLEVHAGHGLDYKATRLLSTVSPFFIFCLKKSAIHNCYCFDTKKKVAENTTPP